MISVSQSQIFDKCSLTGGGGSGRRGGGARCLFFFSFLLES